MKIADLIQRLDKTTQNLMESLYLEDCSLEIENAILTLASSNDIKNEIPGLESRLLRFHEARQSGDDNEREQNLTDLYIHLHSGGALYLPWEREKLTGYSGHTCLPAGLLPVLFARHLVNADTVVADLGAGNGIQGLLLQRLQSHRRTVQVELSAEMIRMGHLYRKILGIDENRLSWIHGDMADFSFDGIDLFYLYRPAKPTGGGDDLYRTVADKLLALTKTAMVFSVADCLEKYLKSGFELLYSNGHITVFRNRIR
ncbi:hypothetical protein ACFLU6_14985 [Acidobacteriota bacterium]